MKGKGSIGSITRSGIGKTQRRSGQYTLKPILKNTVGTHNQWKCPHIHYQHQKKGYRRKLEARRAYYYRHKERILRQSEF